MHHFYKRFRSRLLTLTLALISYSSLAHSAILQVDINGQLMGATGIQVNNQLYDVAFEDGRFIDLFPSGYLPFISDSTQATLFANALLDQVFVDGVNGTFDSSPALTNGCSVGCRLWIPYQNYRYNPNNTQIIFAENTSTLDGISGWTAPKTHNTGGNTNLAYAVFSTSSVAAVPEPSSRLLLLFGLVLVTTIAHKKITHLSFYSH